MSEAGVEFSHVSYALPSAGGDPPRLLLNDISLRLQDGTTTALLGRSGSGKTTLLRMVNGMARPTAGEVLVGGRPVPADPALLRILRRGIGYSIQETGLFPHLTIAANAGLAMELAGRQPQQIAERVRAVMALVGMDFEEFSGRYPWQLSGGQRQRVGLARALAMDPALLLMDEPFGALDPMTRAEMQEMLKHLLDQMSKTVLLVTHDLQEALFLAGRVLFVEAGEIVADLPAADVRRSHDPRVRDYLRAARRGG